jgi:hypothetical protein
VGSWLSTQKNVDFIPRRHQNKNKSACYFCPRHRVCNGLLCWMSPGQPVTFSAKPRSLTRRRDIRSQPHLNEAAASERAKWIAVCTMRQVRLLSKSNRGCGDDLGIEQKDSRLSHISGKRAEIQKNSIALTAGHFACHSKGPSGYSLADSPHCS